MPWRVRGGASASQHATRQRTRRKASAASDVPLSPQPTHDAATPRAPTSTLAKVAFRLAIRLVIERDKQSRMQLAVKTAAKSSMVGETASNPTPRKVRFDAKPAASVDSGFSTDDQVHAHGTGNDGRDVGSLDISNAADQPEADARQPAGGLIKQRVVREATRRDFEHAAVKELAQLDDKLEVALGSGAIKLVNADYLRGASKDRFKRRQDLENLDKQPSEIKIFLSPAEAIKALRANSRSVGALTYGWCSPNDPDPSGAYLSAVSGFLQSESGKDIVAVFWDYLSLHQWPRTDEENERFGDALKVMGDVYASALGTTVMRHRTIPPRPPQFDGQVIIILEDDLDDHNSERANAINQALSAYGKLEEPLSRLDDKRWLARFAAHEDAEKAAEAKAVPGAEAIFCRFNERPYEDRGWTNFESGVSMEAVSRAKHFDRLQEEMKDLPSKVVEIDSSDADDMKLRWPEKDEERINLVREKIRSAFFTGKGDKDKVVELYNHYIVNISNALAAGGEALQGSYEGERNPDTGKREGQGTLKYKDGSVYAGQWKADDKHGRGRMSAADGTWFDGQWVHGKQEGEGQSKGSNGAEYNGQFKEGMKHGRGTMNWPSRDHYTGEWRNDQFEGNGTYSSPSKKVTYTGQWVRGQKDGNGREVNEKDGETYHGEWNKDKRKGRGKQSYSDGSTYDGQWRDDKHHGVGVLEETDPRIVYDGCFKEGEPDGICKMTSDQGEYHGQFVKGVRHGHGKQTLSDGSEYEGSFVNDLFDGQGRHRSAGGSYFDGQWRKGRFHGRGTYYNKFDGSVYQGDFKNGLSEGSGKMRYANGDVYEGQWRKDRHHGLGKFLHRDGTQELSWYDQGDAVREGVRCYRAGPKAGQTYRLRDGQRDGAPIAKAEAEKIQQALFGLVKTQDLVA